jgi:hypothetical protein
MSDKGLAFSSGFRLLFQAGRGMMSAWNTTYVPTGSRSSEFATWNPLSRVSSRAISNASGSFSSSWRRTNMDEKASLVEISAMLKNILARHKAGEDIMDRMAERIRERALFVEYGKRVSLSIFARTSAMRSTTHRKRERGKGQASPRLFRKFSR